MSVTIRPFDLLGDDEAVRPSLTPHIQRVRTIAAHLNTQVEAMLAAPGHHEGALHDLASDYALALATLEGLMELRNGATIN